MKNNKLKFAIARFCDILAAPMTAVDNYHDKKEFDTGFSWAATELLKGTTLKSMEAYVLVQETFETVTPFDQGVMLAITNWKVKTNPACEADFTSEMNFGGEDHDYKYRLRKTQKETSSNAN